jgi:hemerythrin
MAHIDWTEDLAIGIPVIDGQHRRIVDYINQLDAIDGEADRAIVGRVLSDLVDYTYSHFAFEEALMEEAGYDFLSIHRGAHQAFCSRIDQLRQRFGDGEQVAAELAAMLGQWLVYHIRHDDGSYAGLVREKMLGIERRDQGSWLKNTLQRYFGR